MVAKGAVIYEGLTVLAIGNSLLLYMAGISAGIVGIAGGMAESISQYLFLSLSLSLLS